MTMPDDTPVPEMDTDIPAEANEADDPVAALQAENAELRDRMLRLAAEMDNLRKQTAREIADTRSYAIAKFARDMLAANDSLARALMMLPADARNSEDTTV
jgi:molecular chaperone GrpE